jgi:hypothetical protein
MAIASIPPLTWITLGVGVAPVAAERVSRGRSGTATNAHVRKRFIVLISGIVADRRVRQGESSAV